jgi:hypothetical protein
MIARARVAAGRPVVDARIALAMSKQHCFFKLIPPRPTFPFDITSEEKLLMDEHSRYFEEQFAAGIILLYGRPGGA